MERVKKLGALVVLACLTAGAVFGQTATDTGATATTSPTIDLTPIITLNEAVSAAKATSPNLKLTTLAQDTARAALSLALAKNGVTLGENGDYSHQGNLTGSNAGTSASSMAAAVASGGGLGGENFRGGITLSGPATSLGLTAQHSIAEGASNDQVSGLSLTGSQMLFDGYPGGQAAAAVQQAQASYRMAQIAYDAAMKSTVYQVKQAYYTLLGDQDTVILDQAIAQQAAENLTLYQGLYTAQKATTLDVLEVQVALTQAQLDVRTAQNTVMSDRRRLSLSIGWPIDKQYSVADSRLPDPPALILDDALKMALQNRAELLTLEQEIAAADIALSLQKSQSMPVVSISASLGVGQDWTANANTGAFTAGVNVALPPLYDGGLQGAQVQQATDLIAAFKVQQAQERQSITIDVQNALFGVTDAKDRNALAVQNLHQAQGQYDLQKEKLAVGLGTTLDELTAFSALATARVGLEQSKISYLLALLNLDSVMGQ